MDLYQHNVRVLTVYYQIDSCFKVNESTIYLHDNYMIYHNRHLLVLNTVVDNSNHVFEIYYVRVLTVNSTKLFQLVIEKRVVTVNGMELYIVNLIMPSGFVWYLGYLFISALSSRIFVSHLGINRHFFDHPLYAEVDRLSTVVFL